MKRGGRVRLGAVLASAAIIASSLAGCAAPSGDLSQATAGALQKGVVAVAESAAAGDPATALTRLDELQQQLASALADGDVGTERAATIQAAIDVVRADLQPAPVTEPAPEPEPESPVSTPVDNGGNDVEPDNSGPGNNNGNGSGNGNGNGGKGKGKGGG